MHLITNIFNQCGRLVLRNRILGYNNFSALRSLSNYKSSICLENLHPSSSLLLTTPSKPPEDLKREFSGYIPIKELVLTYSRSSGPGGQHANTANTKVDLRFHVATASWLNEELKAKILTEYRTKITSDGYLVVRSELTRSQLLNVADALERLRAMIRAATRPSPIQPSKETEEMIRRRKEKANRMRLSEKRTRSLMKASRNLVL